MTTAVVSGLLCIGCTAVARHVTVTNVRFAVLKKKKQREIKNHQKLYHFRFKRITKYDGLDPLTRRHK